MKVRILLMVGLLVASGFAIWSWARPYEWGADPAARCRIVGVEVRKDHANFWVNAHLKLLDGMQHDLMKPVRLEVKSGNGTMLEPADTTLAGDDENGTTEMWFKFWIDENDLAHPLALHINDGTLELKTSPGMPRLGSAGIRYFVTNHW